jgi:hypothetical protein
VLGERAAVLAILGAHDRHQGLGAGVSGPAIAQNQHFHHAIPALVVQLGIAQCPPIFFGAVAKN